MCTFGLGEVVVPMGTMGGHDGDHASSGSLAGVSLQEKPARALLCLAALCLILTIRQ